MAFLERDSRLIANIVQSYCPNGRRRFVTLIVATTTVVLDDNQPHD